MVLVRHAAPFKLAPKPAAAEADAPGDAHGGNRPWVEAVRRADSEAANVTGPLAHPSQLAVAEAMGMADVAAGLGSRYKRWTVAFMLQELHKRGMDPQYNEGLKFRGRASAPLFKQVALRPMTKLTGESLSVPGGAGLLAMLWAQLHATVMRLRAALLHRLGTESSFRRRAELVSATSSRCRSTVGDARWGFAGLHGPRVSA